MLVNVDSFAFCPTDIVCPESVGEVEVYLVILLCPPEPYGSQIDDRICTLVCSPMAKVDINYRSVIVVLLDAAIIIMQVASGFLSGKMAQE